MEASMGVQEKVRVKTNAHQITLRSLPVVFETTAVLETRITYSSCVLLCDSIQTCFRVRILYIWFISFDVVHIYIRFSTFYKIPGSTWYVDVCDQRERRVVPGVKVLPSGCKDVGAEYCSYSPSQCQYSSSLDSVSISPS